MVNRLGVARPTYNPFITPSKVLGVAPRVVAGAARGDDDVLDVAAFDLRGQRLNRATLLFQEPRQDVRLLVDFPVDVGGFQIDHENLVLANGK